MSRLLILTAGYGEGHNAAARNLAAAAEGQAGPGTAAVADLFALASPRFNRIARRAYLAAINGSPRLWSGFYAWSNRSGILPRQVWMLRAELRALRTLLAQQRPAVICGTFPIYAFLLRRLAAAGATVPPYYTVVTDSISIHSLWAGPGCAGWFVPNDETAEVMRRMAVPPERIHALGFPVPAYFSAHAHEYFPPDLAAGAKPRVLYIIHSGVRHADETARRLISDTDWDLTFAVGRDERLRRRLEELAAGRSPPAQVLGWTNEVPRLLMTHHVVLSKAGGATTQEAIAARCPMLVNQVVPGQEEGNYELLRRHQVGALVETPDAAISALRRAFADGGAVWSQWRAALAPLNRPDASRAIATRLLNGAGHPATATAA